MDKMQYLPGFLTDSIDYFSSGQIPEPPHRGRYVELCKRFKLGECVIYVPYND